MGEWIGMFLFSWLLLSCLNGNPKNPFRLPLEEQLKPIFRYARFVFFVQLLFFVWARVGSVDLPYLIWLWPIGLVLAIIIGLPFFIIQLLIFFYTFCCIVSLGFIIICFSGPINSIYN